MPALVSVLVLNHKQISYVPRCLNALRRQSYPHLEIIFTENASEDSAADYVRSRYPDVKVIANTSNLFFSKAQNAAIKQSSGRYVMPLNVDVVLQPNFIEQMVRAMELNARVGMVSGKLLQMNARLEPLDPPVIDSTGLWFTPEMRHFDRGSREKDCGQYDTPDYIFGPSGAAPLYRREMLEDLAFDGEYFDEDFVIYREDADLAWRAQWLGWQGVYAPSAVAHHLRRVRNADDRRGISPEINMHSVKNRFLMRIKNQTAQNYLRFLLPTLWRDCQVVGYVSLVEHSSLVAFRKVFDLLPRMLEKRKNLMRKKRVSDRYIALWFSFKPVSFPCPKGNAG